MRLDQYIVQKGWATSRTKAQEMIDRGEVRVLLKHKEITAKSSLEVDEAQMQIMVDSNLEKFVSRAGFKLENALKKLQLDVSGFSILDIGISTGGFTDCLLQSGASSVVGIDVGTQQLHVKLQGDSRIKLFENTNAKDLSKISEIRDQKFDLVVIDVSFISLEKILPGIAGFLQPRGHVLALFKPQFEVGPQNLNKQGLVSNPAAIIECRDRLINSLNSIGLKHLEFFETEFPGRDGNKEYFLYMAPNT